MKIDFFDVEGYGEVFDRYKIMNNNPKAIEECKNIYYYGDTLHAFIWNGKEYIEYLGTYDCVSEGSKYSKVELAYNIGKWHDDMYLFTDKGD